MRSWTMEALTEMNLKTWAPILRFTGIVRKDMYETRLFDGSLWQRPDSDRAVSLLAG